MLIVDSKVARDAICNQLKRSQARKTFDIDSSVKASLTAHQRAMRSKVFEHLEAINYTKDRVSFSADVMELWLDNG